MLKVLLIFLILLFVISVIWMILYNSYKIIEAITNYFFRDYINRYLLWRKIKPAYKAVLQIHSEYYKQLSSQEKDHFERRVQKFIYMKSFIPRGELKEVTEEMKALIASAAIQLTFGYPSVYFLTFDRILIYDDNYYSDITRKYHQGEVSMRGYIVLSWKNFVNGYSNPTDGRNLGLHEMAHALMLENAFYNYEYDFLDFDAVKEFNAHVNEEMIKINNGGISFFRAYAATDMHEFFAVAVENFFERASEFYAYDAHLYSLMCRLLQQNPLEGAKLNLAKAS